MAGHSPTNVDRQIAKLIRERREERKMTQTELGDEIGVTFQQVQKYENAANRISAGRLFRIAKALKVSPMYFFEDL